MSTTPPPVPSLQSPGAASIGPTVAASAKRRRFHHKSRAGCIDCRRRRVKCDEQKPSCRSCVRRHVACSYHAVEARAPETESRLSEASGPASHHVSSELAPLGHAAEHSPAGLSIHSGGPSPAYSHQSASSLPPSATTASDSPLSSQPPSSSTTTPNHHHHHYHHPHNHHPHLSDLALLHHWTLATSLVISREPSCADLWQRVLPEIGFAHPFVEHALLGLAALHIAYELGKKKGGDGDGDGDDEGHAGTAPRRQRRDVAAAVARAVEHHDAGLRGFRRAVADITEANSEAIFAWSLLNLLYVFGMLARRDADPGLGSEAHLASAGASPSVSASSFLPRPSAGRKDSVLGLEWIPMLRGVQAVLDPTYMHLRSSSRLEPFMRIGNWEELEPGPPMTTAARADDGDDGDGDAHICRTRETWAEKSTSDDAETYDQTLQVLRKCRIFIRQFDTLDAATLASWGYNRAWSGPLLFILSAPQAYFNLLRQRQLPALVLFAYFGAFLHILNGYWFMEGLGREIVEVVDDLLGAYWRPWIAWPLRFVGLS